MNSGVNAPRRCFTELFLHRLQYQVSFPLWRRPQHQEHKLSHFKTFGQYEYPVPDNNVLTTWSVFSGPPPVSCTNEATGNLGLEQPEITDWTMLRDTPEARGSWRFFIVLTFISQGRIFFFSHLPNIPTYRAVFGHLSRMETRFSLDNICKSCFLPHSLAVQKYFHMLP